MPIASHAFKRLSRMYGSVLRRMRVMEWLLEHGRRWGRSSRPAAQLALLDALEPRQLLSSAPVIAGFENANPNVAVHTRDQVQFAGTFTDQDSPSFTDFKIDWGDGFWSYASSMDFTDGNGAIGASRHYNAPGVYYAVLKFDDGQGNQVTSDPVEIDVAAPSQSQNTQWPSWNPNQRFSFPNEMQSIGTDPGLSIEGDDSVTEYDQYTLTMGPTELQAGTIEGWMVDWGDDWGGDVTSETGSSVVMGYDYQYAGQHTLYIEAELEYGQSGTFFDLTVNPIAITIGSVSVQNITEEGVTCPGDTIRLTGSFTGPDYQCYGQDYYYSSVNWGDGSETLVDSFDYADGAGTVQADHQYTQPGTYHPYLTIDDAYDTPVSSDQQELDVSVSSTTPTPTATIGNTGPVSEGGPVTVSLADGYEDSTENMAAGLHYFFSTQPSQRNSATYGSAGTSISQQFNFADNGIYTVYGRVLDQVGAYTDYSTAVTVNNVAPSVTIAMAQDAAHEGDTAVFTGSFTDPGATDTHTYLWEARDSSESVVYSTSGDVDIDGLPDFYFTAPQAETYSITLTVTDNDAGQGSSDALTISPGVAPQNLTLSLADEAVLEGGTLTLTGTFTEAGPQLTHTVTIDWQDGSTPDTLNLALGVLTFSWDHVYAAEGYYFPFITVTDSDQGSTFETASAAVYTAQPIIQVTGPGTINQGDEAVIDLSAAFEPLAPGLDHWLINWDDGGDAEEVSGTETQATHLYTSGNGAYTVSVTAYSTDDTPYDAPDSVYVSVIPAAPTDLVVNNGHATWTGNPQLDVTYRVEGSADGNNYSYWNTVGVTSYDANPGWWIRVCAVNADGDRSDYATVQAERCSADGSYDTGYDLLLGGPYPGRTTTVVQGYIGAGQSDGLLGGGTFTIYGDGSVEMSLPADSESADAFLLPPGLLVGSYRQTFYSYPYDTFTSVRLPSVVGFGTTVTYGTDSGGGWYVESDWTATWSGSWADGVLTEAGSMSGSSRITVTGRSDLAVGDFDIVRTGETQSHSEGTWYAPDLGEIQDVDNESSASHVSYSTLDWHRTVTTQEDSATAVSGQFTNKIYDEGEGVKTGIFDYSCDSSYSWTDSKEARVPAVSLTAYRTGDNYNQAVSLPDQRSGDPANYVILTNNNYEQDPDGILNDMDYNAQLIGDDGGIGLEGIADHDLAKIKLLQAPQAIDSNGEIVSGGTVTINLSNPEAVRVYDSQGDILWDGATEQGPGLTGDLSAPSSSYLAGLANGYLYIYVEGLSPDSDFCLTYNYAPPSGSITPSAVPASIHMAIGDLAVMDTAGDPLVVVPGGITSDEIAAILGNEADSLSSNPDVSAAGKEALYSDWQWVQSLEFMIRVGGVDATEINHVTMTAPGGGVWTPTLVDSVDHVGLAVRTAGYCVLYSNVDGVTPLITAQIQDFQNLFGVSLIDPTPSGDANSTIRVSGPSAAQTMPAPTSRPISVSGAIYHINNPNGGWGFGHSAVILPAIVGGKPAYQLFSFQPLYSFPDHRAAQGPGMLTIASFPTAQAALAYAKTAGYTREEHWNINATQAQLAQSAVTAWVNKTYDKASQNCWNMVFDALSAALTNAQDYGAAPNIDFRRNEVLADDKSNL